MNKQLTIIGASGHGKVIADIALQLNRYDSINFLDDNSSLSEVMGIPVVGRTSDFISYVGISDMIVAIGNACIRRQWIEKLHASGARIPMLLHPHSVIGTNVAIGSGTVVMAGAVINPDTVIGEGCIINTCASVDHDCTLENYVHVAVGAHLAGGVFVKENTWIGAGAVIRNNIHINEECMIGAGAVVVKDIDCSGVYVGVPAEFIVNKRNKE